MVECLEERKRMYDCDIVVDKRMDSELQFDQKGPMESRKKGRKFEWAVEV